MWKATFIGIGIYLFLLGAECLVIDSAHMRNRSGDGRVISPPEYAPWSLMSAGAVTVLYSFTLPSRLKSE